MGLGLPGAYGVAGAQQAFQELLAQRMMERQYADRLKQQALENQLRERQFQSGEELKRAQLADLSESRHTAAEDRRMGLANAVAEQLPPGTALAPTDPAVGVLQSAGRGALLTHQAPTLPSTQYSGAATPAGAAKPAGFLRTAAVAGAPEQYIKQPTMKQIEDLAKPENKRSPIYQEFQDAQREGYAGSFEQYMNEDANRRKPVINLSGLSGLYNQIDPKQIAQDIIAGHASPELSPYGRPAAAAIASELARRKFPLAQAQRDYYATKRHVASLNSTQQVRLAQAIDTADHSLDVIEQYSQEFKRTGFPALNAVNLAAAMQGLKGPAAQAAATKLQQQIGDVTAELANAYMGGGVPTDQAMHLASLNLNANWSEAQLAAAIKNQHRNLRIRLQAMQDTSVAGVSPQNPYNNPVPWMNSPTEGTPQPPPPKQSRDPMGLR